MRTNNDRDHKEMKVSINHALTGTKRDADQIESLWKELTKLRDGGPPSSGKDGEADKGESLAKMVHRLKD